MKRRLHMFNTISSGSEIVRIARLFQVSNDFYGNGAFSLCEHSTVYTRLIDISNSWSISVNLKEAKYEVIAKEK